MFQEVADLIGPAAAAKLKKHFAGTSIWIPMPADKTRAQRNAGIRRHREDGKSIEWLMRKFTLSRRSIWAILQGNE